MALTAEQQRAIECEDHDILLQAGAGSGKTSTTVSRYERLLAEREPSAILVFTFTDKAAGELRERIRRLREASGRNSAPTTSAECSATSTAMRSKC